MDGEVLRHVETLVQIVLVLALAAYTYIGDKDKVTTARLAALEKALIDKYEEHGERLAAAESAMRGQVTHKDLGELYDSINRLAATVNQLVGETAAQSNILRMMLSNTINRRSEDG